MGRLHDLELRVRELEVRAEERAHAVGLQAVEYERRLEILNHENARVTDVLAHSVAQDRFDDYVRTERARSDEFMKTAQATLETALERVNERHDEFVRRYDTRQKEVDAILWGQSAVQAEESKHSSRTLSIVSVALAAIVIVVNVVTQFL